MDIYIVFDSSNYALRVYKALYPIGIDCKLISIPCKIANGGCSVCLNSSISNLDIVLSTAKQLSLIVRAVYKLEIVKGKNNFLKIL